MTLIRWKNGKPEPVSEDEAKKLDDAETKKEVKKEDKEK
jgi:hypothetical protein